MLKHQTKEKETEGDLLLATLPDDSESEKPRRRTWRIVAFLLLFLALGGVGFYAYTQLIAPANQQRTQRRGRTVSVERSNLSITVTANGLVQAESSINVSPKTSGRLSRLLVKEGDRVREGQILAYMDDSNLVGQLTQAKGQVAAAQANLDRLEAGNRPQDIAQAQANVTNAVATLQQSEIIMRQNQELYATGAISTRDLENARTTMEANRARVTQLQAALSLQKAGTRAEDIEQARAQLVVAQGSLQSVQAQQEDTIVRAPFDGIVTRKYADPGAFVTPTTSSSTVSSATASSILALESNKQVMANVAETNIAQIQIGQEARIHADAYPDKKFEGKIISISPQAIVQQNVTSFEVKASIISPDKDLLRSGMNLNVEFKAGELKDVLVVPTVAIAQDERRGTGVFVTKAPGEPSVFTPIKIGISVDGKTEVKSGLQGNEKIDISFSGTRRQRTNIPGGGMPFAPPQQRRG